MSVANRAAGDAARFNEPSIFVPVPEAARLLGISPRTAWKLIDKRELPAVRVGRRVLVHRAKLEQWAESKTGEDRQLS